MSSIRKQNDSCAPPIRRALGTPHRRSSTRRRRSRGLNLGTRNIRPDVAVGRPRALAWLEAATGARETLPRMSLEGLLFRGWIPNRPWRAQAPLAYNHEICHADCVDESIHRFSGEIEHSAIPFFDALGTCSQIVDFFERDTTFSEPRPNWTLARETVSGAAERFWRADRALLFEVAMGVLADPTSLDRHLATATQRAHTWAERKVFGATPELANQLKALARATVTETPAKGRKTR